jgi:ABC-type multidrug transport system fused ATPase/permease subunit
MSLRRKLHLFHLPCSISYAHPMGTVAELIAQTVQVIVSNRRLKQFLVAEELVDYIVRTESAPKDPRTNLETIFEYEVEVSNASMTWDRNEPQPTLKNISLHATKGDLIAIVGKVGSGKSSLLMSLLGEMEKLNGYVRVDGNIAYVPQQPWVQNQTVRQNIVFGADYDENLYLRVLDHSCLHLDMAMLSMGDLTEIGEKVCKGYFQYRVFQKTVLLRFFAKNFQFFSKIIYKYFYARKRAIDFLHGR